MAPAYVVDAVLQAALRPVRLEDVHALPCGIHVGVEGRRDHRVLHHRKMCPGSPAKAHVTTSACVTWCRLVAAPRTSKLVSSVETMRRVSSVNWKTHSFPRESCRKPRATQLRAAAVSKQRLSVPRLLSCLMYHRGNLVAVKGRLVGVLDQEEDLVRAASWAHTRQAA